MVFALIYYNLLFFYVCLLRSTSVRPQPKHNVHVFLNENLADWLVSWVRYRIRNTTYTLDYSLPDPVVSFGHMHDR